MTFTGEDDPKLRRLTDFIDKEIGGETGWQRLGQVLLKVGQMNRSQVRVIKHYIITV